VVVNGSAFDRDLRAELAHFQPLVFWLLSTGTRLSEAIELEWLDVNLIERRAVLRNTKNGSSRGVPLHASVAVALANLPHREGRVFRTNRGAAYWVIDGGR
jgi:integrase